MQCFNEEILHCTSCHNRIRSKAVLSSQVYRHPILEVLVCRKCYKRIDSITPSISQLCLWCGYPGKYATCCQCSANFCKKCLRNNFNEGTFNNITKKKHWTCFHCLPELLSEHKARCTEILEGMGNNQSLPARRKRSNSESHVKPSTRYQRCKSFVVQTSDDEFAEAEYNAPTNKTSPSPADCASTKEEIMEKANQLSMLFFEVNQRALKFRNKLNNQRCNLKVLQNAFTFKQNLIDATSSTLKILQEELTNTENKWKQEFGISLIVPGTENAKDVNNAEGLHNNSGPQASQSFAKKKKFNLSLKRSLESECTDDALTEDIKEDSLMPEVNTTICGKLLDLDDDAKTEVLEEPNEVQEIERSTVISVTLQPEPCDDDSDHGTIFSEETVNLNFDELGRLESSLDIVEHKFQISNEEKLNSDNMNLCETTGCFTTAHIKSDISQNTTNLSGNLRVGDDESDTSFVFDINTCRSKSPSYAESIDSDATEMYDLDVCGDITKPILIDTQEGTDNQSVIVVKRETEIFSCGDDNSNLQMHNNKSGNSPTRDRDLETQNYNLEILSDNLEINNGTLETSKNDFKTHSDNSENHSRNLETHNVILEVNKEDAEAHNKNLETHNSNSSTSSDNFEIHNDFEFCSEDSESPKKDLEILTNNLQTSSGHSEIHNRDTETHDKDLEAYDDLEIHNGDSETHNEDLEIHKSNLQTSSDHLESHNDLENCNRDSKTLDDLEIQAGETHNEDLEIQSNNSQMSNDNSEIHNNDLEMQKKDSETHNKDVETLISNSQTSNDNSEIHDGDVKIHNNDLETDNSNKVTNTLEDEPLSRQHTNEDKSESTDVENLKQSRDVVNQHESFVALNDRETDNSDDDNNNDDEVAASRTVTPTEPCCSHNQNASELEVDIISDIASEAETLKTSLLMDFEETPLMNHISDLETSKDKIGFLDELGLYLNVTENSGEYVKEENFEANKAGATDDENSSNKIRNAIALLEEDGSDLFDSDLNTSISSMSNEEEDNYIKKIDNDQPGLINVNFPALPEEVLVESESSKKNVNTEDSEQNHKFEMKPCIVLLQRLENMLNTLATVSTSENSELRSIERLTNLSNLDLKRKGDKLPKKGKLKRRKIIKPSGSAASQSETDNSDNDVSLLSMPSVLSPPMSEISCEGMLQALINFNGSTSEFDMDTSGTESEKIEKKKKKRKKRPASAGSNKENQPENQDNDRTTPKELTAEELAEAEKKKWRNDPLLKGKLSESGSGTESDGALEGENILSEKTKKKLEALEARMERRDVHKVPQPTPRSNSHKSENETDEDVGLSSELEEDSKDVKPSIIINDDTDSDIEFVSVVKKKSPVECKPKTSICISSSEEEAEEEDGNDDDDSSSKKKGRKNIRAILSDETLDEKTKKATLVEKRRSDRLVEKQKYRDNIISQSDILSQEEGLILDVDVKTQAPLVVVHAQLTKRFKAHQKEGVRFMWGNCYEGVKELQKEPGSGCILAHCMGLGKSFQVVALVHTLFTHPVTNTKHVLIVCPLSVVLNWKNEFKQGLEGLTQVKVFCISERHNSIKRRLFVVEKWRESSGVLVVGYEAYQRLTDFEKSKTEKRNGNVRKALVDPGPDLVVVDEGHLLKNGKTVRAKALMKVKTRRRIILTGTPLQNNLTEYYHMVQFVKPNLLGSFGEYTNRFVNPIMNGEFYNSTDEDIRTMKKRSHVLNKLLKGTVQRYEVQELKAYLPAKYDHVLFVQLHIIQAQLYQKFLDILKIDTGVVKGSIIHNFHKLHALWTHPYLLHLKQEQRKSHKKPKEMDVVNLDPEINDTDELPDGWWHDLCPADFKTNVEYGPKLKVMLSIIRECEKIGDKVLIFSHSILVLDAIESFLQHCSTPESQWIAKEDYYRMDGTVLPDTRQKQCNAFNDVNNKRTRVFLISNHVGGLGLNLVAANRVILMDVNWNPAYDIQSIFRTYRFGQTKQCYVYRLVSMGTMEEVVYQRQIHKLAVAGRVVDDMQISRHFRSDDLQKMYRLEYNMMQERPPLLVPPDAVLATVIQECEEIFKYHEHQSLLENKPEEELNEDEMKLAWDEFNKENEIHTQQIEEQKRKMMASQAGSSGVNTFLPGNMTTSAGAQHTSVFKNNANVKQLLMQSFKVPATMQHMGTNLTKPTDDTTAQSKPCFEVVLLEDSNKQTFNAEDTNTHSSQVLQEGTAQTAKNAAPPTSKAPQLGNSNQPNSSYTLKTMQSKKGVVMPQIVNTFAQSQAPANSKVNLGYVLPKNVDLNKLGTFKKAYKRSNVVKLPSNSVQQTQSVSGTTAAKRSTNVAKGKNRPNNIQIIGKPQFANRIAQALASGGVNVSSRNSIPMVSISNTNNRSVGVVNVAGKTEPRNTHIIPQSSKSTSNMKPSSVRLTKIKGTSQSIEYPYVIQEIRTVTHPQSTSTAKRKLSTNDAVATVGSSEIIDLDGEAPIGSSGSVNKLESNVEEQQELIRSLHENLAVTISVLDKPGQSTNTIPESPKTKINMEGNAISISAISKNNTDQSNSNDVIEID